MAILCDSLCHANLELQPPMLQLLQIVIAAANAPDFAVHHHPHLVRAMQVASTGTTPHDQAIVVCIKQCIAMKLVEMQEEECPVMLVQPPMVEIQPPVAAAVADQQVDDDEDSSSDSETDEIMFDIEL